MSQQFVDEYMQRVTERDPEQREFHQSVREVLRSIAPVVEGRPDIRQAGIVERLLEPERVVTFAVPWADDTGAVKVNRGFRVQHNGALGPYKGGLRFHASVKLSVIKFLAFTQTFKNALTTLPMGGGKGGSDFSVRGKSDDEMRRFCEAFMTELYRHLGPDTDVPAGDVGVGGREIGYMVGRYRKLRNRVEGFITGKGVGWGGSLIRKEAAGYGTVYFANEMLLSRGESFEGKTVAISGYGNLGSYALEKLNQLGAKVVTIADEDHYIYDPDGISGDKEKFVIDLWQVRRQHTDAYAAEFGVERLPGRPWKAPCDVAIPTAAENEIDAVDAKHLIENGCKVVVEGSNMPCTGEAIDLFRDSGVLFGPGKAANAGGVAVSGLEMTQNSIRMNWTREEVDARLQEIMRRIHQACVETAETYNRKDDYVSGANIAGFTRVAEAMLAQGI